ncbi:hypothetical protein FKN01_01930 [Streptomyces sp. 130]|nr:hypothetical protein FKN01_01930 [Streptomyces sp. 130]
MEDVEVGDVVRTTDVATGQDYDEKVVGVITTEDDKIFTNVTITAGNEVTNIVTTDTHPFWVPTMKSWVEAGDLTIGQQLKTSEGKRARITALSHYVKRQRTHDLTIQDVHAYYVLAGATPVLVHNCDGSIDWVNENANMSSAARAYDAGAAGSRAGVAPALQYYKAGGNHLSQIKFDGLDAANGVMIDRKVSVTTFNNTYRQAMNQSLALEQNGYSGRREVPTAAEAARARKVLGGLLITNIRVRVVP